MSYGDRNALRLGDVFVGIPDPWQITKVQHDLVELLVVAVCNVLVGADTFVEIEQWQKPPFWRPSPGGHRLAACHS